ncbi:hypothetical protein ACKVE0_10255 [Acinetobacter albensis]|uniref:EpsG family protein n=1 Tax=Acinetobacter albensis TaxID=1673609 RepID=A0ABW9JW60_9GAMM
MYQFDAFSNIIWTPILFSIFLILSLKIGNYFKIGYKFSLALYLWHTLFCVIYIWFALSFGADSNKYFYNALNFDNRDFNFGTSFIIYLTYFLYEFLGFSYVDQFLIHGFIGYIGFLAFVSSVNQATLYKNKNIRLLGWIIVFLPSVSFWTTALGKDAISFMALGLALWSALDFKNRKALLFFAIFSMFMVRPHIGAALAIAFAFSIIFDKKTSLYIKVFFGTISLTITAFILPIMINYIGLSEADGLSDVDSYIDKRQNSNLSGGSSLDIASMSFPMQILSYLFRPLPFEAHTFFALIASLDNVVLVYLLVLGIIAYLKKHKPSIDSNRIFLWVYFFICLGMLATTTANLGIAMRQKWMFLPCLIFLLLSVIGSKNLEASKGLKK